MHFESTETSLRPIGGLVRTTVAEFEAALSDLAEKKKRVVTIDLSNLSVIDASGLEAIVAFERQLRDEERVLVLRHPSPIIKRVLDVTGLTWLLEVQSRALELVTSGRFRARSRHTLESFSASLAREIAPFGLHVSIGSRMDRATQRTVGSVGECQTIRLLDPAAVTGIALSGAKVNRIKKDLVVRRYQISR